MLTDCAAGLGSTRLGIGSLSHPVPLPRRKPVELRPCIAGGCSRVAPIDWKQAGWSNRTDGMRCRCPDHVGRRSASALANLHRQGLRRGRTEGLEGEWMDLGHNKAEVSLFFAQEGVGTSGVCCPNLQEACAGELEGVGLEERMGCAKVSAP